MDEFEAAEIRRVTARLKMGAMDAYEATRSLETLLAKSNQLKDTTVSPVTPEDKRSAYGR